MKERKVLYLTQIPDAPKENDDKYDVLSVALQWQWVRIVLDEFEGDMIAALNTLRVCLPEGVSLLEQWALQNGWSEESLIPKP